MTNDEQETKEDGKVWTSYSDMFTTMAIIFLVMFVFALIKAGVSTISTVAIKKAHEEELKGNIPPKVKEQNNQTLSKLDESIQEINQYKNIIDEKMVSLNNFVDRLNSNKSILQDVLQDQSRREAVIAKMQHKLEEQDNTITTTKEINQKLNKTLQSQQQEIEFSNQQNLELNEKISALSQTLEIQERQLQNNIAELQEKLKNEEEQMEKMREDVYQKIVKQEEMNKEITDLKYTIENNQQTLKNLEETLLSKNQTIRQHQSELDEQKWLNSKLEQDIKEYNQQLTQRSEQLSNTKNELQEKIVDNKKQEMTINELNLKTEMLNNTISEDSKQMARLSTNIDDLNHKLAQSDNTVVQLNKYIKEIEKENFERKQKIAQLENDQQQTQNQLERVNQKYDKLNRDHQLATNDLKKSQEISGSQNDKINKLKEKVRGLNHQQEVAQDDLKSTQQKLLMRNQNIEQLGQEMARLKQNLSGEREKNLKHLGTIAGLEKQLQDTLGNNQQLADSNSQLQNALEEQKNQNTGLSKKNQALVAANDMLSNEKQNLERKGDELKKKNQVTADMFSTKVDQLQKCLEEKKQVAKSDSIRPAQMGDLKTLYQNERNKNKDLLAKLDNKEESLKKCDIAKDKLVAENDKFKKNIGNVGRSIASVKQDFRGKIAKELADKFKKANIKAQVDPATGNVTLLMGSGILFATNSAELSKSAKKKIKRIVPIFSEVLFSDPNVKDKIASFNIVGHASPTYMQRCVNPFKNNGAAYDYNLSLSAQRASAITKYAFGKKTGKFANKMHMRKITRSIGQGFTRPVKVSKKIKKPRCGSFGIHESQRVELSFTLKDDIETINKIFNLR